ncbi:hypothetical protein HK44_000355 [Pseudomonas fluorescens HK44]|uniref:Uncharacterized protein n=1 Tax=Pseudomonas fluorescens HK44 TaxID=1042209 RepID=A0A010TBI9_PSEFL|nr:hypothetical protein HK44_000355 [Pseudomonas fluorescens HK44]
MMAVMKILGTSGETVSRTTSLHISDRQTTLGSVGVIRVASAYSSVVFQTSPRTCP